jgi:dephospho-CoA kinase
LNELMARRRMVILGLTGSIGMGKSVAAQRLRRLGIPVHDADAEVHRLLRDDSATIRAIGAMFPGVIRNGAVDRAELGRRVFGDAAALRRLESIIHPRVQQVTTRFLRRSAGERRPLVALDIPLLFETGGEQRCDAVAVVSAPGFVQAARVLHRPGMTAQRLAAILARQTPDAAKQQRADFVVPTGLDRRTGLQALARVVTLALRPQQWRRRQARRLHSHA